ncbi:heterocyst frequency control protein PatD [Candidatus Gracilibacteria bacterium]|nr:heterocyst frequency control protein PatD [Candidatus Gracilibacteria bacterium]NJM90059.1 heterocyst frequency control protein PatD [Hydrococcus sp. RU_2_2]NJP20768.1 heterocyst frequency control protein PatD [Hydrococcus sp. CRU_1_1]
MLPTSHQNSYQKFLDTLLALREEVELPNFRVTAISEKLQKVQQVFQEEVMLLESDDLPSDLAFRFTSVQTEIHRALRLLGTDMLFLRSSKQVTTSQQRLSVVRDRVNQIVGYCQVILTFEEK